MEAAANEWEMNQRMHEPAAYLFIHGSDQSYNQSLARIIKPIQLSTNYSKLLGI